MLTRHSLPHRRRRATSISSAPPASFSGQPRLTLTAFARKALPELPADAIDEMVKARTLAENITILAATMPAVTSPQRWIGLLDCVPARVRKAANARARAMGMEGLTNMAGRPLAVLDLIEAANG